MRKIELEINNKIYAAFPCEKNLLGYTQIACVSEDEIKKSKKFICVDTDEFLGQTNEDLVIHNENNLGFVISRKEIEKGYGTYLSCKGKNKIKRLLLDKLLFIQNI